MAAAAQLVNPNADVVKKGAAAMMNINAARGLQDVLSSNLGPKGTLKMLVSGAGDIKLTKDGHTLLYEMQIQNPTANMIARVATAQDDITGDGTTSSVLIVELVRESCWQSMMNSTSTSWKRSDMSAAVIWNRWLHSNFLKIEPFSSTKLFETSSVSSALLEECIATCSVTTWKISTSACR